MIKMKHLVVHNVENIAAILIVQQINAPVLLVVQTTFFLVTNLAVLPVRYHSGVYGSKEDLHFNVVVCFDKEYRP